MWIINDINPAEPEGRELLTGMGLCPALVWGGIQAPPAWCPRGAGCLAGLESHPIPHPCAGQAGQGHPGWPWWLRDLCGFVATAGPGQVFLPPLLLCPTPSSGVLALIIPLGMASQFPWKGGCCQPGAEGAHGDRIPKGHVDGEHSKAKLQPGLVGLMSGEYLKGSPRNSSQCPNHPFQELPSQRSRRKPGQFSPSTLLQAAERTHSGCGFF